MTGLATAALLEAGAGEGLFAPLSRDPTALGAVCGAAVAAIALAAGAAAVARSRPGAGLLEPVLTSLTAPARALAAVALPPGGGVETASALDAAVDALLAKCVFQAADFVAPSGLNADLLPPPPAGSIDAPDAAIVAAEEEEDFSDLDVW